jgi:hypothetical protein
VLVSQGPLVQVLERARELRGSDEECASNPGQNRAVAESALKELDSGHAWRLQLLSDARCHSRYKEAIGRSTERTTTAFLVELLALLLSEPDEISV